MCSVDWRPAQPPSSRMLKAPLKPSFPIGDQFQQFFRHAFHANTASLLAQASQWALPAISPGRISWAGPFSFNGRRR